MLNRKHASLQFLYSLASTPAPTHIASSFLPSLAPPPLSRTSSKATTPIEPRPPPKGQKGKSKADLLREYRLSIGSCFPSAHQTSGYLHLAQVNHTYPSISSCAIRFTYSRASLVNMSNSLCPRIRIGTRSLCLRRTQ